MALLVNCISTIKAGGRRFNMPSADLARNALKADKNSLSSNFWRIPIEDGLGDKFIIFSNEGKRIAEAELDSIGRVGNLTLYEYSPKANLVRRTHSFGTPDTTFTDILECTKNGEVVGNISVNRSHDDVQRTMDKYFGPSVPEYIQYGANIDNNGNGFISYVRNPEAIPHQYDVIKKVLNMFGLSMKDLR